MDVLIVEDGGINEELGGFPSKVCLNNNKKPSLLSCFCCKSFVKTTCMHNERGGILRKAFPDGVIENGSTQTSTFCSERAQS